METKYVTKIVTIKPGKIIPERIIPAKIIPERIIPQIIIPERIIPQKVIPQKEVLPEVREEEIDPNIVKMIIEEYVNGPLLLDEIRRKCGIGELKIRKIVEMNGCEMKKQGKKKYNKKSIKKNKSPQAQNAARLPEIKKAHRAHLTPIEDLESATK